MASPIEEAFADLCAKHNLTAISVGMNLKQAEASRFDCSVHFDGYSRRGIPCCSGHAANAAEAVKEALARAAEDRTPFDADIPALTLAEAA